MVKIYWCIYILEIGFLMSYYSSLPESGWGRRCSITLTLPELIATLQEATGSFCHLGHSLPQSKDAEESWRVLRFSQILNFWQMFLCHYMQFFMPSSSFWHPPTIVTGAPPCPSLPARHCQFMETFGHEYHNS